MTEKKTNRKPPAKKKTTSKQGPRRIADIRPPEELGAGRTTSLKPEFIPIAKKMCEMGATDVDLAEAFSVHVRTVKRWRTQSQEFRHATRIGKDVACEVVARSLYERATGYTFDTEKVFNYQGEIVRAETREHVPPDTASMIFWLCNQDPDNWKQISRAEITGKDGGPIETKENSDIEQARRVAYALGRTASQHQISRQEAQTVDVEGTDESAG
jgi:hypothetical protein